MIICGEIEIAFQKFIFSTIFHWEFAASLWGFHWTLVDTFIHFDSTNNSAFWYNQRNLTSASEEKRNSETSPHFKIRNNPALSKAAMDLNEYKPSDTPYTMPHPAWYVFMLFLIKCILLLEVFASQISCIPEFFTYEMVGCCFDGLCNRIIHSLSPIFDAMLPRWCTKTLCAQQGVSLCHS